LCGWYVEWLALGAAALVLGSYISLWFAWDLAALLVMGCAYNLRPLRTSAVSADCGRVSSRGV